MKGQAAIDYFTIISVALLILVPLFLYVNQLLAGYSDDNRISLANDAVNLLGQNADWVYSQGSPAKRTIKIYMPENVEEISLDNKMILFKVKTSAGTADVYYNTVPNLNGFLSTKSGYYYVSLSAFDNYVNITVI